MRVWLPTIRAGTGADIFVERLAAGLYQRGVEAILTWFNHYYELFPFLLKNRCVTDHIDIIHANSVYGFAFRRPDVKLIVTVHHHSHDARNNIYKSALQRIYHAHVVYHYEARSFAVADRITAVSHASSDHISKAFSGTRPVVIYNGIDTEFFRPGPPVGKGDKFKLLFVGKPSRGKGFDLLQPIMKALGNNFILYYTGGTKAHALDLSPNTQNVGRLEPHALLAMYRECDALLFPSRYEGFGYAVCEAMACGKPVIAGDNSSLPELVQHNETGLLCKTDDIDAFVAATRLLADNPDLARRMGEAGRERVLQNFTLEKMTDNYIRLYEATLSS
jgi:glycosyltransferase involved in cell wall biosynthesis